jgi:nitroreductase
VGATTPGRFVVADCWLAAENLMLTACALGLGSCVIGLAVDALNDDRMRRLLGLPPDFNAIAPIVVGTPADPARQRPTPRKPPRIVLWR